MQILPDCKTGNPAVGVRKVYSAEVLNVFDFREFELQKFFLSLVCETGNNIARKNCKETRLVNNGKALLLWNSGITEVPKW